MPIVETKNLNVIYLNRNNEEIPALKGFSVSFKPNAVNVVLGESGSGKTTLLRAICQQFDYDGEIYFDGIDVSKIKLKDRKLAYIDQSLFLFNHMIVYDIIAYPLKQLKYKSALIDKEVKDIADRFNISNLLTRKPNQLSIGQRQKVSLCKALVKHPNLCLMDEPFSNLSELDKEEIMSYIRKLVEEGITFIYVTHNYLDALALGDYYYVIDNGELVFEGDKEKFTSNKDNELIRYLKESVK